MPPKKVRKEAKVDSTPTTIQNISANTELSFPLIKNMKNFLTKSVIFPNTVIRFKKLAIKRSRIVTLDFMEEALPLIGKHEEIPYDLKVLDVTYLDFKKFLSRSKSLGYCLKTLRFANFYTCPPKNLFHMFRIAPDIRSITLGHIDFRSPQDVPDDDNWVEYNPNIGFMIRNYLSKRLSELTIDSQIMIDSSSFRTILHNLRGKKDLKSLSIPSSVSINDIVKEKPPNTQTISLSPNAAISVIHSLENRNDIKKFTIQAEDFWNIPAKALQMLNNLLIHNALVMTHLTLFMPYCSPEQALELANSISKLTNLNTFQVVINNVPRNLSILKALTSLKLKSFTLGFYSKVKYNISKEEFEILETGLQSQTTLKEMNLGLYDSNLRGKLNNRQAAAHLGQYLSQIKAIQIMQMELHSELLATFSKQLSKEIKLQQFKAICKFTKPNDVSSFCKILNQSKGTLQVFHFCGGFEMHEFFEPFTDELKKVKGLKSLTLEFNFTQFINMQLLIKIIPSFRDLETLFIEEVCCHTTQRQQEDLIKGIKKLQKLRSFSLLLNRNTVNWAFIEIIKDIEHFLKFDSLYLFPLNCREDDTWNLLRKKYSWLDRTEHINDGWLDDCMALIRRAYDYKK